MAIELLCPLGGGEIHGSILAPPAPLPLSLLVCYCNLRQVRNPTLQRMILVTNTQAMLYSESIHSIKLSVTRA